MWLQIKVLFLTLALCFGKNVYNKRCGLNWALKRTTFTPSCVSQTLAFCEHDQSRSPMQGLHAELKQITDSIKELKLVVDDFKADKGSSLVQVMQAQLKPITDSIKELKLVVDDFKADLNVFKKAKYSARNCADLQMMGDTESGIGTVHLSNNFGRTPVSVFCDQTTDGGGWTVIQRRADLPQREDFYRGWVDYQLGFGNLTGEFWLGLDNIHSLVNQTHMELRVELEDFNGEKRWAKYSHFYIEDSAENYRINIGAYEGDAGNAFSNNNDQEFSTKDADNDSWTENCAEIFKGSWWYERCSDSNLNGFQHRGSHETPNEGIYWTPFRGFSYSLKSTLLSVRPRFKN